MLRSRSSATFIKLGVSIIPCIGLLECSASHLLLNTSHTFVVLSMILDHLQPPSETLAGVDKFKSVCLPSFRNTLLWPLTLRSQSLPSGESEDSPPAYSQAPPTTSSPPSRTLSLSRNRQTVVPFSAPINGLNMWTKRDPIQGGFNCH